MEGLRIARILLGVRHLLLVVLVSSCCRTASAAVQMSESIVKALAEFNRGAALLEQYQYAQAAAAFKAVLDVSPQWTAARFNLGLAYLNMQEESGAKENLRLAQEAFAAVLQSDPNHLHARFCLGLYYQHAGDSQKALESFRAVHRADSADPYVAYKCAEALVNLGKNDEASQMLEKVVELDPGFVSAVYRLAMQYQRTGRQDKAKILFARFKELKEAELTGGSFTVLNAYGTVGKYYMALGSNPSLGAPRLSAGPPRPVAGSSRRRIVFSPELKMLPVETAGWKCPGGSVGLPGIAAGDVDGDGDIDLCITSAGANGVTSLWYNDGTGKFSQGATLIEQGVSPCFGDVDNDGDLDLWLGRAGPDRYFENDGQGKFRIVESVATAGGQHITGCARLVDIDSDGDLDFLAFRFKKGSIPGAGQFEPAPSSLYNNNTDGSFTDIAEKLGLVFEDTAVAAVVSDDFDNDRDLDLVVFPAGGGRIVSWVNDRVWKYRNLGPETTGLSVDGNTLGATSGDPDGDGDRDLLVFTDRRIHLFKNQGGFRFKQDERFADRCGRIGASGGQFADMDNDGDLDIVVADMLRSDGKRGPALFINDWPLDSFTNVLDVDPGNLLAAVNYKGNASCVVADFTGDGKCDVLIAPAREKPLLIENATSGGHWIEIDLSGTRPQDNKSRSNNSAVGARVDIKTGTICQQYVIGIPSGPVACPPFRVHAGLGSYTMVDWLRITWPDAVLQAELGLPADQVVKIAEIQRKVSSCPHLFAWNGTHFEFVSDFGGMGGIGYLLGPGAYSKPDPTEYVPVPDIKPLNGEYIFQVLEPIEEVAYFDEAKLLAVDHPAGTEVYPNEMMAVNAPPPAFELFCIKEIIEPVRAIDHRGADVTEELRAVDRTYAGATKPDRRFIGFAEDHFVELDFGERLQAVSPQSRLVLFLHGWVEYPYSSTNYAASQAGMRLRAPSVQVFRGPSPRPSAGVPEWTQIFHEVGYPGGIRHVMTLDVTGKVLPSDQRIRISSNMELYWDRIFVAPILGEAGLTFQEVPVKNADLHFLGYPREYSPDGRQPNLYDYGSADRALAWKVMDGRYTRYGEVTELVQQADDRYVIMGPGEELTLRFSADALGPTPKGHRRSFVLKTESFCKDMDLYSAHPDTVEPLPFHSMSGYPYGPDEKYPDDPNHREYRQHFNTRDVLGGRD